MRVPVGASSCASCEYLKPDGKHCWFSQQAQPRVERLRSATMACPSTNRIITEPISICDIWEAMAHRCAELRRIATGFTADRSAQKRSPSLRRALNKDTRPLHSQSRRGTSECFGNSSQGKRAPKMSLVSDPVFDGLLGNPQIRARFIHVRPDDLGLRG